MPVYVVERTFGESFDPTGESLMEAEEYFEARDIRWLTTFLSADKKKSYCLYEAESADLLIQHAQDTGFPLDSVMEVTELDIPRL
ncbi:MAG: DUF4242 domain-containing protein [Acidimicrobiales bacterium]